MNKPPRKYVLDTQLFIDTFRDPAANEALQQFHRAFLVVRVSQRDRRAGVARAWHKSGDLLAQLAREEGLEIARLSKSFGNDVLLAFCCRRGGCVLVTDNRRDFQRIRRFVQFEFTAPWPDGQMS